MDGLSKIYAAKKNHLPSVLVQRGGGTDWIPGPRIIIHSDKDEVSDVFGIRIKYLLTFSGSKIVCLVLEYFCTISFSLGGQQRFSFSE